MLVTSLLQVAPRADPHPEADGDNGFNIGTSDARASTSSEMIVRLATVSGSSQRFCSVENPALQAVLMALETRNAIGALTDKWRRLGHELCHPRHYRLRRALRLRRYRNGVQCRLSALRRGQAR